MTKMDFFMLSEDRQHTDRTTWLKRYLVLLGLMAVALLVALVFVVARKSNVGPPPPVIQVSLAL